MQRDYTKDNERAKEAIAREEEFLKEEVIGKGVESSTADDRENEKTNLEKTSER